MAATIHSDPYAIFMRRIGYSVGLEHTFQRLTDLERLYVSNGDLTLATWKNLVESSKNGWGLKTDNIADVYFSLRFIQKTAGDIFVLENLDSMAIACKLLEKESERKTARSFIFLWAILMNDGEIFVNLLLSNFDKSVIKEKLSMMINNKRSELSKALPGRESMNRILRILTIERQESNKGSAGIKQSITSLNRTEPLQKSRLLDNKHDNRETVDLSADYFRKVPPRRKDWARSLGLWDDKTGLTCKGTQFKNDLIRSGYINNGYFTFWPMDYELIRGGFRPDLLSNRKNLWTTLTDFAGAFSGSQVQKTSEICSNHMVGLTQSMMKQFRSLHVRKSMLRHEIPITIVYPVAIAVACAKGENIINFPAALEQQSANRRIVLRRSRHTGGALSVIR